MTNSFCPIDTRMFQFIKETKRTPYLHCVSFQLQIKDVQMSKKTHYVLKCNKFFEIKLYLLRCRNDDTSIKLYTRAVV